MAKILVVDDEKPIRGALKEILEYEKHTVDEAANGQEAYKLFTENEYDVVFCDIKMPVMDGLEFLSKSKELGKETQIVIISAHGNIDTAVEATKKGAFDFIQKPLDLNRLLVTLRNALDKSSLETTTKVLKQKVGSNYEMIGDSPAMRQVKDTIAKVATTDARVLILGPNGSGKELVARALHSQSNRAKAPLVEVNCAAIPSELIESELFGHEKGAFTSAIKQKIGKFEQAEGGTLFLDEIGDMSLSAQAKVLRALQEKRITRVGGEKDILVDVRVIAATNKDLKKEIVEGRFREDLYHRLSVIVIQVPSLNDRKEDIPLLVNKFLNDIAKDYKSKTKKIEDKALEKLETYDWTGNVRELRNVVERLVILSGDEIKLAEVEKYVF
ncbi:MAG TPA: sigma-54 dependent transcriptional regulator [Cytophagales bacterium]|nr:sigma-54 dependent transcriptional regulator [Cytophagales bacterium]